MLKKQAPFQFNECRFISNILSGSKCPLYMFGQFEISTVQTIKELVCFYIREDTLKSKVYTFEVGTGN